MNLRSDDRSSVASASSSASALPVITPAIAASSAVSSSTSAASTTMAATLRPDSLQPPTATDFSRRDRSHLSLDPNKRRFQTANGPISMDSPLSKELLDFVQQMISPDKNRSLADLSPGFQALIAANQLSQQPTTATFAITTETPTPSKIIYPKSVTEAQETFAEGFTKALHQVQLQNQFVPTPSLQSPSAVNLIFPLLAALTPTLSQPNTVAPLVGGGSTLSSPVGGNPGFPGDLHERLDAGGIAHCSPAGTGLSPTTPITLSPLSSSGDNSIITPTASDPASIVASIAGSVIESAAKQIVATTTAATTQSSCMNFFNQNAGDLGFFGGNSHGNHLAPHHPPASRSLQIKTEPPTAQPPLNDTVAALIQQQQQQNGGYGVAQTSAAAPMPSMAPHPHTHPVAPQPHPSQPMPCGVPSTAASAAGGHFRPQHNGIGFDMDEQEQKKLARKRERNRVAASKCRLRKLERIQELEQQVSAERQRGAQLDARISEYMTIVKQLKELIQKHQQAGCQIGHS